MKQHSALNRGLMFEWLKDLDDTGDRCPSDDAIMERFDFDTPEQARTLLADLADKGLIVVKGAGADRVVTIRGESWAPPPAAPIERPVPSVVRPQRDVEATTARIMNIVQRCPSVVSPAPRPMPDLVLTMSQDPAATRNVGGRPPKGDKKLFCQISFRVTAADYRRVQDAAEANGVSIAATAARLFDIGMSGAPAEPIHKPLIRANVIRAARDAGIPLDEFVASLIECGLQRFLAAGTLEIAA